MIIEAIFGLSLVLNVSLDVTSPADASGHPASLQMSVPQREAALLPLVRRATNCIVRQVTTDPRYRPDLRPDEINNLIADSFAGCARAVRAMIKAHDRMYGKGSGEAFLLGPYLDVLPSAVVQQVKTKTQ